MISRKLCLGGKQMSKAMRVLSMYDRMMQGKGIVKVEEANRFGVDTRTIQRDLDDIRAYLAEERLADRELLFDRKKLVYAIVKKTQTDG